MNHLYGPLKVFKSHYREILDHERGENIMKKVQENKIFELSKIINRCTDDYESIYDDPAIIIGEDDPLYNSDEDRLLIQPQPQNLSRAATTDNPSSQTGPNSNIFDSPFAQSIIFNHRYHEDIDDFLDREANVSNILGGRK